MNDKVQIRLWQVRERVSRLRIRWAMALLAAVLLALGTALYLTGRESLLWQRSFIIGLIAFCAAWILVARVIVRHYRMSSEKLARLVEARYPELKQSLITVVDPQVRLWGNPLLTRESREKSLQHAHNNRWEKIVSIRQRLALVAVNLLLLAGFGGLAFLISTRSASGRLNATTSIPRALPDGMKVDPGTIEVERGSSVTISASFGNTSPLDVQLVTWQHREQPVATSGDSDAAESHSDTPFAQTHGDQLTSVAMRKSLQDPIYSQLLSDIREDMDYTVVYDNVKSDAYHITVFDYPELVRSDATMIYPVYTGLEESRIENTKRVRMVQGTKLKWQLYLNKPVTVCELVDESGKAIETVASPEDGKLRIVEMSPSESVKLKVNLRDESGRAAKLESYLYVTVTPNLPPVIKLTAGADKSVSPLEEWAASADISDDFGVVKHGISYNFRDHDFDVSVEESNSKKVSAQNIFDMESLQSVPDDLLTYWFWAEDYDADGNLRRTSSDLYFAETRPFEEIFRQGQAQSASQQQQQQQQGGGAGQKAEELLQLQKQIVSATWNIRRQIGLSEALQQSDLDTVIESQSSALEQLQELKQELTDGTSQQAAQSGSQAMQKALEQLAGARAADTNQHLGEALASEQQAYQALLRLRAREHEISMSQRQSQNQSGNASGQQRQRQIDQLQLEQNEDRYETQSEASEPQEQQASEQQREIQNRLKELAQRQSDLNEQIRQLEAALQQAQSEKEQRDAQEQLKRLREAQEELLRDTDELLEQMNEQQDDSQALQQAAEQTQQSRQSLEQATQNLRDGQTSEALSAGTRAQQSLDQTQEDLRKNSAEGLSESLRELRSKANEMVQQQQDVQEKMETRQTADESAGLRSDTSKEELQTEINQQRERLKELQKSLQETVLQAEQTEPLVADALYDTFQQLSRERVDEQLQAQSILMDRAMPDEALKMAGQSLQQMQNVQEKIDNAASDVLGSELADLERAASELERLREQLGQEIGENTRRPGNAANDPNAQNDQNQQGRTANGQRNEQDQNQNQDQAAGEPRDNQEQDQTDAQAPQSNSQSPNPSQRGNPSDRDSGNQNNSGAQQQQSGDTQQPQDSQQQNDQQPQGNGQQQSGNQQPQNNQQQGNQRSGGQQQTDSNQQGGERQSQADAQQPQGAGNARGNRNSGGQSGGGGLLEQLNEMVQDQAASAGRPLTGEGYRQFNDALRDVGQLLEDRDDRALAEGIRQAARQMRSEYRRHSKAPERDLVDKLIVTPLDELIDRVGLELQRKRAGSTALVPLDNDPVPPGYDRAVRVYYENLGTGR